MLTKDKAKMTIDRLPEQIAVDQIVEQLIILRKIEEGMKDIEEGSVYSTDLVRQELKGKLVLEF